MSCAERDTRFFFPEDRENLLKFPKISRWYGLFWRRRAPVETMSKEEDTQSSASIENEDINPLDIEAGQAVSGEAAISAEDLSALLQKLEEATAEIQVQKERYLRTVADLENYRKRAMREKDEARKQATCGVLEDLLPVLDNFKLGLKSAEQHEGGNVFADGFRMILAQMESALKQSGLEEINPEGGRFDPNFHESVAHFPHESVEDGHIIEVHRIGYKLNERLLRPAAVVVSSGAAKTDSDESENA
jgi:molecular chaperone GrpE